MQKTIRLLVPNVFIGGYKLEKYAFYYDTPVGRIYIAEANAAITDIAFSPISFAVETRTPLLTAAADMLHEYFRGERKIFDLPLNPQGTEFQKKAWDALLTIPYGQTRTYKEQAEYIGNAKACRAVGAANGKNPISIVIPCHRVIGTGGALVGFGGGLEVKRALLELENRYCSMTSTTSTVSRTV